MEVPKVNSVFQMRLSFFKIKKEAEKFRIYYAGSSFPHNYPDNFKKTGFICTSIEEAYNYCKSLA